MKQEVLKELDIRAYYRSLTRTEKSWLLNYLCKRYGMSKFTLFAKFNGKNKFTLLEEEAIRRIIDKKPWDI